MATATNYCMRVCPFAATDNHIGYAEKDPERGKDSVNTFEEVLQLAQGHNVDFILQGGDLFHDNKPSRAVLHRTMQLLRQYCVGDRPVGFRVLSDQATNFQHCRWAWQQWAGRVDMAGVGGRGRYERVPLCRRQDMYA